MQLAKVPFKHRPSLLIYVETLIRAVFDQGISVNLLYVAPPSEVPVPNHLGVSFIIHSKNWIVPTLEGKLGVRKTVINKKSSSWQFIGCFTHNIQKL